MDTLSQMLGYHRIAHVVSGKENDILETVQAPHLRSRSLIQQVIPLPLSGPLLPPSPAVLLGPLPVLNLLL